MKKFESRNSTRLRSHHAARIVCGIAVAAGSITAQAQTKPALVWCDNCSADQVTAAVLNVPGTMSTTTYVADLHTGAIGAYNVYADVDDSKHPPVHTREVIGASTDSSLVSNLKSSIEFYQMSPIGWRKSESLMYGGDPGANAWSVANAGKGQQDFNTWLNSSAKGARGLASGAGAAIQTLQFFNVANASVTPSASVTVTFDDGSKITGTYDPSSGALKADPETAVDAENNPVPYLGSDGKAHRLGGVRHFDTTTYAGSKDLSNFTHQLLILNVPSGSGGSGSGSGGTLPWVCVESPGDDGDTVYTCTAG